MLELLNEFVNNLKKPEIKEFEPSNELHNYRHKKAEEPDIKLLSIIHKLEKGKALYKPVLFETPDELKDLGKRIYLVNTESEAQNIIKRKRTFACTYSDLKRLILHAKAKDETAIETLMIVKIFEGKEIQENKELK